MQAISEIGTLIEGVWLPKNEKHLVEWMTISKGAYRKDGKISYQWKKQKTAMDYMNEYIPNWEDKIFCDVGAHVGLWSMWWGPLMNGVIAFEPIPAMQELYHLNMAGRGDYLLMGEALGNRIGNIDLAFNPENTGNTHLKYEADTDLQIIQVHVTMLDTKLGSMPNTPTIGALKIDCEGVEEQVILGAEKTIKTDRPLIIVEQKKGASYYGSDPQGAVTLLKAWGYRVCRVMSGDYIMVHGDLR